MGGDCARTGRNGSNDRAPQASIMTDLLEKNLAALEEQDPEAARRIRELPPEACAGFEFRKAKSSFAATALYTPPDGGRPVWLASRYDPMREIDRWVEAHVLEQAVNVIYVGMGLGYSIQRHVAAYPKKIRHIVIIERSVALCRMALAVTDLGHILGRPHVKLLLSPEPTEIADILADFRTDYAVHNVVTLPHPPSLSLDEPYYKAALNELTNMMSYDQVNIKTAMEQRGLNQFNLLSNLVAFWLGIKPRDVHQRFQGLPGIVIAAGPSLDKNVHELQRLNGRAVTFAVDTAQTTLKSAGFEPDFVVTCDPTPLNFSHFENVDDLGRSFLAFHPECNHRIVEKYGMHPYFLPLCDQQTVFLEHLIPQDGPQDRVDRGMMVGQLAYNLARHMGCDPIIIIGMDLAFPRDGGTTHAKSAAVSRTVTAPDADSVSQVGSKEGKAVEESGSMRWVDGYDGQPVPTTDSFKTYIVDFENFIEKTDARVINATGGGAKIHNAEQAPLAEVLDSLRDAPEVRATMDALRTPWPVRNPEEALLKCRETQNLLEESDEKLTSMLRQIARWPEMAENGEVTEEVRKREWDRLERDWLDVVSNPLFDKALGQAVTHIYYRRQRADDVPDGDPGAFLQVMHGKYEYILGELIQTARQFRDIFNMVIERFEKLTEIARERGLI